MSQASADSFRSTDAFRRPKISIRIQIRPAAIYAFAMTILFLAGMTMESWLLCLFYLFLILPILSLVQVVLSLRNYRYFQSFSNEHPVKNQNFTLDLTLSNPSVLPSCIVNLAFKSSVNRPGNDIPPIAMVLKPGQSWKQSYVLSCRYRGIYTFGLESLSYTDTLGWLTVKLPAWFRTFYVLPRIVDVTLKDEYYRDNALLTGGQAGREADMSLLEKLTVYREGMSIRHLSWRSFAALGVPFIKEYATSALPGIDLLLDLDRREDVSPEVLLREDLSLETALSFMAACVRIHIPVRFHAFGPQSWQLEITNDEELQRFHQETVNMLFGPSLALLDDIEVLVRDNLARSSTLVFVTHRSREAFSHTESYFRGLALFPILNLSGAGEQDIADTKRAILSLPDSRRWSLVLDDTNIKEALE